MSIRTTVTLEDDVVAAVKRTSRARGATFRETLNDLVRAGVREVSGAGSKREFRVEPLSLGYRPEANYDDIEGLIDYLEGPRHR